MGKRTKKHNSPAMPLNASTAQNQAAAPSPKKSPPRRYVTPVRAFAKTRRGSPKTPPGAPMRATTKAVRASGPVRSFSF